MLLSARPLKDVANVNSFEVDSSIDWTEGDQLTLYIQLIDASVDTSSQGYNPAGRRYCAPATSTLTVIIENIDDTRKVTRVATQPYTGDASIWSLPIFSTDRIRGQPQVRLTLVTPSGTISGCVKGIVRVHSASNVC
jgi:hypothetical protein